MMILTFSIIRNTNILTFDNQEYIKDIVNPYSFVSVNCGAENCTAVAKIDYIGVIGNSAFDTCTTLTEIDIPNSVTTIGHYAFRNCFSLSRLVIPDSVTTIGYAAFYYCSSLSHIIIPDSVTTIGHAVFYGCESLTQVKTNDENAYIIEYCKKYYPSVEVIVVNNSYILK